jgi:hypothetical protein
VLAGVVVVVAEEEAAAWPSALPGVRPRSGTPWRSATRYTDDSEIPKRELICETGVLVEPYRFAISRSCSSLNLRRAPAALRRGVEEDDSSAPVEGDCVSLVVIIWSVRFL